MACLLGATCMMSIKFVTLSSQDSLGREVSVNTGDSPLYSEVLVPVSSTRGRLSWLNTRRYLNLTNAPSLY